MGPDLWGMSLEELNAENQRLGREADAIKEQRRELARLVDLKVAEREAQIRVDTLSDVEKRALTQVLTGKGLLSEEAVGQPRRG